METSDRVIHANGEPLTLPPAPEPAKRKGGRPRKAKPVDVVADLCDSVGDGVAQELEASANETRQPFIRNRRVPLAQYEHDALWVRKHEGDSPAEPPAPGSGQFAKATAHMGAVGWRLTSVVDETRYIDHKHIRGWMTFWERVKL